LALLVAASVRLFLMPARDSPRHADAIFVLGGSGKRLQAGVALARKGFASTLVVSTPGQGCPAPIPGVRLTCFVPHPYTTQGEARYLAALARENGWEHVIAITTTEQATRARLRIKRCTDVDVAYVTTPEFVGDVPYALAYEWAALAKALVLQRNC
jgi:uncharacterized SAM-binding protein YcdF (DUF218 family)